MIARRRHRWSAQVTAQPIAPIAAQYCEGCNDGRVNEAIGQVVFVLVGTLGVGAPTVTYLGDGISGL
jgi:hypothetical protein